MATKVKIDIELCSDEDLATCFQVLSKSFGSGGPFVNVYFPNHSTEFGQIQGSQRLLAWKNDPEESFFLKAVMRQPSDVPQETSQKIIGFAVWTLMKEAPPVELEQWEDVEAVWPDKEERELMRRMWKDYIVPRSQAVAQAGETGVFVLELLAVHPEHQRLGAGSGLVNWGLNAADKAGLEAVVESTPAGRRTYEKSGFGAVIEEMVFDFGTEFADRQKPKLVFMKRKAKV